MRAQQSTPLFSIVESLLQPIKMTPPLADPCCNLFLSSASSSHPETHPKTKQAAWIQRDFRKLVTHKTPQTKTTQVTFNDEPSDQKRSQQTWIWHKTKHEATI
jgi:hypothetical protein